MFRVHGFRHFVVRSDAGNMMKNNPSASGKWPNWDSNPMDVAYCLLTVCIICPENANSPFPNDTTELMSLADLSAVLLGTQMTDDKNTSTKLQ
jgi:hypothetical protein